MTGLEIAILVGVVAFVVVGAICIGGWLVERSRKRGPFELSDISLTASRPVVLVGQNSDLRFYFTVNNPAGEQLAYDGRVEVQDLVHVNPQQNGFSQQHFRTEVPRLHCTWTSVGSKRVDAFVTVQGGGKVLTGYASGFVEVVAKLPDENRPS